MAKFRTLLKNRNFVLYSIGQTFSQFGDRLVQIVLIGLVYKRWPGSAVQLAKLFFFTVVPSFFISPVAGVYVDRWNRGYVAVASDMLRAAMILVLAIFFIYRENIVPLYIILFIVFAAACFFLPARLSIIPSLVAKKELLLANSASSITWVVAGIVGFSFGGFLVEWIGIKNSLYVNSLVYLLSAGSFAALILSVKNRKHFVSTEFKADNFETILKKSFLSDFAEGVKAMFSDERIKFVTYIFFILAAMGGALYVVSVIFVQEELKSMTKYIGVFSFCLFSGLLLGSYLYGKAGYRFPRVQTIFVSLIFSGISIILFAIALKTVKSFWFGCASAAFFGFFLSPVYTTANTIVHESVEERFGGRVFSYLGIVMNLGFLLCMFMTSIVAERVDRFWILIACGSFFAVFGFVNMLAGFSKKTIFSSF